MTKQIALVFGFEKQTPGAVRYKEITTPPAPALVGTLYLRKTAFVGADYPDEIRVTLEINPKETAGFKPGAEVK